MTSHLPPEPLVWALFALLVLVSVIGFLVPFVLHVRSERQRDGK